MSGGGSVIQEQTYKPHHYQEKAIRFMLERACAGLFLDP